MLNIPWIFIVHAAEGNYTSCSQKSPVCKKQMYFNQAIEKYTFF